MTFIDKLDKWVGQHPCSYALGMGLVAALFLVATFLCLVFVK